MKKALLFIVLLILVVCGAGYLGFSTHNSQNKNPIKQTKKIEKQSKKSNSQKNKNNQEENKSSQTDQNVSDTSQPSQNNQTVSNANKSSQTDKVVNNANQSQQTQSQQPQQNQSDSSHEPVDGIDGNSDYGIYAASLRDKGQTPPTYAQFAQQNHFQMAPNSDPITGASLTPDN
ncbi:hypothetical protein ACQW5G_08635 [Fructilactobacillus sp. Tb1]|uniref:hypothetical protein n=1 Tax=Fructilactobacillus sp. Tb1 TaxID=3422304 RepID=UPI003D288757